MPSNLDQQQAMLDNFRLALRYAVDSKVKMKLAGLSHLLALIYFKRVIITMRSFTARIALKQQKNQEIISYCRSVTKHTLMLRKKGTIL